MKRIFAFLLAVLMLVGMVPVASVHVHAEEAEETVAEVTTVATEETTVATEEATEATEEATEATEEVTEATEETTEATEETTEATEEATEATEETTEATEETTEATEEATVATEETTEATEEVTEATKETTKAVEEPANSSASGITWNLTGGTLTISGSGAMPDYDHLDPAPWNAESAIIKKVIIQNGITHIGDDAFNNCTNLRSIVVPSSVLSVGYSAFAYCNNLTDIYITDIAAWMNIVYSGLLSNPLDVNSKIKNLYLDDKLVTELVIPEGATVIPEGVFQYFSLQSVKIPNTVTSIDEGAFQWCTNLKSVSMPDSVKTIGEKAFAFCSSLKAIALGSGVTSIGDSAFESCTNLRSITIPSGLTSIGWSAFAYCNNLTDIYITDITAWMNVVYSGLLSNPLEVNSKNKNLYLNDKLVTDLVIPEDVTTIPKGAFQYLSLRSVTIPNTVTSIDAGAFQYCSNLQSVSIPVSVTMIGENTFLCCSSLKELVLGSGVTTIGDDAFNSCTNLKSITIPSSLISVGWSAFNACNSLTEIYISDLTAWMDIAYGGLLSNPLDANSKVKNLYLNNALVTDLVIPENTTVIPAGAFQHLSLQSVTIPSTVASIDEGAFRYCTNLKAVTIGENVNTISEDAFQKCTDLTYIEIPVSVNQIGQDAFAYCDKIWHVLYGGAELEWAAIGIHNYGNDTLTDATFHYQADASAIETCQLSGGTDLRSYKCKLCNSYSITCPALSAPALKATRSNQSGKAVLSWEAMEYAVKYEIRRATKKTGTYSSLGYTEGTSFEDSTATVGKTYYYKVRAIGFDGSKGKYSESKSITCKCAAPVVTAKNTSSSGKVKLSWKKVSGAKKYYVYRVSSSGKSTKLTTTTKTYYTDSSAKVGTTYYYKVKAVASKSTYNSAYSALVDGKRICAQPDLAVKIASNGKPSLSWDKVSGAKEYKILRADTENGEYILLTTTTATSYKDSTAEFDKDYWYQVDVVGSKSGTDNDTEAPVSIHTTCAKPSVSVKLSKKKPLLTWKPVEGATKYYVYRATSKSGKYKKVATVTDATSYRDSKAKKGKTYYYKVKAIAANSEANSAYSSVDKIKSK